MKDMRRLLRWFRPFVRRTGRDGTVKRFWSYVKRIVILDVVALCFTFMLPPAQAFVSLFLILVAIVLLGSYSMLSLRLRLVEERFETGRLVNTDR